MLKLKSFAHVDFLGGAAAAGWAVGAQYVQELNNIVSWEAAAAFAVLALGRWVGNLRKKNNDG